jgi:hypothetical protein
MAEVKRSRVDNTEPTDKLPEVAELKEQIFKFMLEKVNNDGVIYNVN